MKLNIHRGTHEIGGSCVELTSGKSRIVIDIGMPLVDSEGNRFDMKKYQGLSGPDLVTEGVLPDIKGFYKWDKENGLIDGLLISHPHMDHYGFFDYVHPDVTYYLGESAKKIIDITVLFTPMEGAINKAVYLESSKGLNIGEFKVTPYLVDHAAFDSYAFVVKSGGKTVIYSGDIRAHGRKIQATRYFLDKAPRKADALLLEGTMMGRFGEVCRTENDLEDEYLAVMKKSMGAVLFYCSAQNIDRLVTAFRAARRSNKIFVIDFYTATILTELAKKNRLPFPGPDFKEIKVFYPSRLTRQIADNVDKKLLYPFKPYIITKEEIGREADNIVMLVRPSMVNDLRRINGLNNSQLIYSMWEGYLEDAGTKRLLGFAKERGIQVKSIHTSGHADKESLRHIVKTLNPRRLVPIHTFNPESYKEFNIEVLFCMDRQKVEI